MILRLSGVVMRISGGLAQHLPPLFGRGIAASREDVDAREGLSGLLEIGGKLLQAGR